MRSETVWTRAIWSLVACGLAGLSSPLVAQPPATSPASPVTNPAVAVPLIPADAPAPGTPVVPSTGGTVVAVERIPAMPTGLVAERPASGPFVETPQGFMVPYRLTIPGTSVAVEMVPIPGGEFSVGSPEDEEGRTEAEGPQVRVTVEPFWMAKTETSWAQYQAYMAMHDIFKGFQSFQIRKVTESNVADAITAPSNLYDPSFTYVNGQELNLPAVTMSQYAAKQYTKWLSGLTGQFFRLPSEAEWEYAARAGTKSPWSFGDDADQIEDYAWTLENSGETHPVGLKKPNPWGLHDMHGNVAEWVLDGYSEKGFAALADKSEPIPAFEAIQWPTEIFPRTIKGGSYQHEAPECRSASKFGSQDDAWRVEDPNFPKSPWWFTEEEALGVGFRVIRPLNPPTDGAVKERFWKADHELIQDDVDHRINNEGRGALGLVDQALPGAIKVLQERK